MLKEYKLSFDYDAKEGDNCVLISDAKTESDVKYSLSHFFEKSNKLASYFVKEDYKKKFGLKYDPMKMSFYKTHYISQILPICQLLLVAKDLLDSENCIVKIRTDCGEIAENIATHLNINKGLRVDKPYLKLERYAFFPKAIYKILLYIINSIFVRPDKDIRSVLLCFGSDRFISPYYSHSSIVYPIYNWSNKFSDDQYNNKVVRRKFISLFALIGFIPNFVILFFKGFKVSNSLYVALEQSLTISIEVLLCISLKRKYKKITHLIGTFETNTCSDVITRFVNNQDVKTVIVPHGLDFSCKFAHLSYGANVYCTWSPYNSEIIKKTKFLEENCEIKVTGNPIYKKMYLHSKDNIKKRTEKVIILLALEHVTEDYCRSSPYQSIYFEHLVSSVVDACKSNSKVRLTIRSRDKGKVYDLAKKFEGDVKISTSLETPIEDDLVKSDIVITQYSNALNEALIFGKMVIHVDLFKINFWHRYMENPNFKRVNNLKDMKTVLTSLVANKSFKTTYSASSDMYNFYNCQHLPYKIEG
jgi:hypothetical protein